MRILVNVLDRIVTHAAAEYPTECCGLLVGDKEGVVGAAAVRNLCADERTDRFELDPVGHVRVWEAARAAGYSVVGCYHSHPDGTPRPSSIDRRLARTFGGPFGYLVLAIHGEGDCEVYAGRIGEDGEIESDDLVVVPKGSAGREVAPAP